MNPVAYLWAIVVLGAIIFIHELGHFLAAKSVNIRVHEFALGFGPKLLGVVRGETTYSIRAVLLGGFVRMAGMDGVENEDPRGFAAKPVWQRMFVIVAGPLMNFVLAVVIFAIAAAYVGETRDTLIAGVIPGSPAAAAGLMAGDRVMAVGGQPIMRWSDLSRRIQEARGQAVQITLQRGDRTLILPVQPLPSPEGYRIGVEPKTYPIGFVRSVTTGVNRTVDLTVAIFSQLAQIVSGREEPQLAGPVGIVRAVAQQSQEDLWRLVQFAALLSINVGILNLLPFPALDGSRLAFLSFEAVRGRPINPGRENMIHLVGFVFLLGLMAVLTYTELTP